MPTTTPVLGLLKPIVGDDDDIWGGFINQSFDILDTKVLARGTGVAVVGTAPTSTVYEPLWWDTVSGQLFVRYDDGTSLQWVTANSIDASMLEGSFLALTGGTVHGQVNMGDGTAVAPPFVFNGTAGTEKGLYWQDHSVTRWRMFHETTGDMAVHAFGDTGSYLGMALRFTQSSKTVSTNYRYIMDVSNATPLAGTTGVEFIATNTGANVANGHRLIYNSSAGNTGFDVALTGLALFDPVFIAGQAPVEQAIWLVAQSPHDTTHNWACCIGEFDVVNRGNDEGWARDRTSARWTGGVLMAAESFTFGGGAGEGKNATFAWSVARSGSANSTGFPAKFYNGYLVEPNSIVGLTGRAIYMTGDITGDTSQFPYGPMQTDGAWAHGVDHTRAVYNDGYAELMAVGQRVGWIVGTTGSATAVASITATGSGTNATLVLSPSSTGSISLAGPITGPDLQIGQGTGGQSLTVNGASGADTGIKWATANNMRWKLSLDASNNLFLYSFGPTGTFIGSVFAVAPTLFQVQVPFYAGQIGFNGSAPIAKPAVTGAKGGNAALASLLTALAAYGLVTDSST